MDQQEFDPTATSIFGFSNTDEPQDVPVALSARDRDAVDALPAGSALLIVQRGPNTGARFLLDPNVTYAGRSPKSDIFLDDVTVSRKHCQFIAEDGGHIVRDSGSLNGTYVNRERVEQARLNAGDEVQIGKYRLTYQPSPQRS
ncbi:FHA domain-containing protein [Schaalia sp. ZJ405]|uniref:FHA domain-containing protein n=1 Tax=unclassified Schaalia TaxID=2691889 RepID=UPI0013EB5588|nr:MULTISPECIES: FHA domain-containing protein [unclassified Schaalia]QPK80455.1 FHA domain-containing protein [Schaalia sp. ZJ405]